MRKTVTAALSIFCLPLLMAFDCGGAPPAADMKKDAVFGCRRMMVVACGDYASCHQDDSCTLAQVTVAESSVETSSGAALYYAAAACIDKVCGTGIVDHQASRVGALRDCEYCVDSLTTCAAALRACNADGS